MHIGDRVEVHTRFDDSWSTGFEVAEIHGDGCRLRRLSDGSLLPNLTGAPDMRPADWGAEANRLPAD